ncbi:MAG TPA: hypothetical protein VGV08_07510 [Casimicrobiaceae bacterium]|nr:hypothetical protein [Casimicrobiaceae bacterium]
MNPSRRRVLFAGTLGALAFATARLLQPTPARRGAGALSKDGVDIMRALVPALLAGALPPPGRARDAAIAQTIDGIGVAMRGLAPIAREELASLFSLLAFAPLRIGLGGMTSSWENASVADADAFLVRLQSSRWTQKRAAYDALHQITFAAWYANPRSWPAIGYPGPPRLT